MSALVGHQEFRAAVEALLAGSYRQFADVGEVLATAERIGEGDADSWLWEWTATAGSAWAMARAADRAGRRVSALSGYHRAAAYYAAALQGIAGAAQLEPDRELRLWRRQRACWERTVDLLDAPGERLEIQYETTTLPGYFIRAPDAAAGQRRPLVIINNGLASPTSHAWVHGGAAAAERGYHWMTLDGPGQQAALYERGLTARPDWEAVLTPVLDAMREHSDVDPDRVAVIGVGDGGYLVARALSFEHRFAAAVTAPGLTDLSAPWLELLTDTMHAQLHAGQRAAFDREMHLIELFSPATTASLRYQGRPYGINGSPYVLYQRLALYRLGAEIQRITTPLLVTDSDHHASSSGQSRELFDRLPGPKQLARPRNQPATGHGYEPMPSPQREALIFDWLDQHLS